MALHIKKIMDDMLIFTVLSYNFNERVAGYFAKQAKKLIDKGYKNILVDLTNVNATESNVAFRLNELNGFISDRGGSLKFFGVEPSIADRLLKNTSGYDLNIQVNEIIDTDIADLFCSWEATLAS